MLIIWGKSRRLRPLGFVADHCPVCRQIAVCHASELCLVTHLYYIPTSRGQPLGTVARCESCQTRLWRPVNFYRTACPDRLEPVRLLAFTNPFPLSAFETRLAIDLDLEHASPDTRVGILCDTIQRLSYDVATKTTGGASESTIAVLLVTFMFAAPAAALMAFSGIQWWWIPALLAAASLILATIVILDQSKAARERAIARALTLAHITDAANPQMLTHALNLAAETGSPWAATLRPDRIAAIVARNLLPNR